jgi:UDP-N-acetylmuramoyl-tripeptide--D-alanyl-D-alanine ligase
VSIFSLARLLAGAGGTLITSAEGPREFSGVSTDTRTLRPGEVFFALKGPNHDGADHLRAAWQKGAAAAVIPFGMRADPALLPPIPLVAVPDTLAALQAFAAAHRAALPVEVVAVTRSVGKTTTKEMAAALFPNKGPTAKTAGNLNNHVGVPLTLLTLDEGHRWAVVELGASAPGEIARLAALARPRAAVITRLGWAHLGGFGGHRALVDEKGAVLDALPADGWCALDCGDDSFPVLAARARCRVVSYGVIDGEVRAERVEAGPRGEGTSFTLVAPGGSARVTLRGFGRHFLHDALAAAAVALPAGISPEQAAPALSAWEPAERRGAVQEVRPGLFFIDDTYNANPLSMRSALEGLAACRERGVAVAVLGAMAELGPFAEEGYRAVGGDAARLGVDYLVGVGAEAEGYCAGARAAGMANGRVSCHPGHQEAARALLPLLVPGAWVLFKGSRAARMDELLAVLRDAAKGPGRAV